MKNEVDGNVNIMFTPSYERIPASWVFKFIHNKAVFNMK